MSSQSFFLVRAPTSAAISRRRLVELANSWRLPEDEDSRMAMTTVVSELVTNAVSHGAGDMLSVAVRADLGKSRLLLEVHDSSPVLPRLRCPSPESESGRGMVLVEHLSIACGAENTVRASGSGQSWPCPGNRRADGRPSTASARRTPSSSGSSTPSGRSAVRSPGNRQPSAAADGPSASGPHRPVRPSTTSLLTQPEGEDMNPLQTTEHADENDLLPVEIGEATVLTEGHSGGQSEDKRRAYNS
ncbi:ATP-binding protein [Streptomyces sp. SCSIO-PteL053]|nr:ATP-binding protein [Streptomyces sp. SCSIO-PteL053]